MYLQKTCPAAVSPALMVEHVRQMATHTRARAENTMKASTVNVCREMSNMC